LYLYTQQVDEMPKPTRRRPKATSKTPAKAVVNLRMDADLLARIDAAAKRIGISRSAWLHVAASKVLENDDR
jgi:hypothetical protein